MTFLFKLKAVVEWGFAFVLGSMIVLVTLSFFLGVWNYLTRKGK